MAMDASIAPASALSDFLFKVREDRGEPVSKATADTYASCVVRVRKIEGGDPLNESWLLNSPTLDDTLNSIKLTSRKTILTALLSWMKLLESRDPKLVADIQRRHDECIEEYNNSAQLQRATEKQKANWCSMNELRSVIKIYERQVKEHGLLRQESGGELAPYWKNLLRKWLVAKLYVGSEENPPVRLDYRSMRLISKADWDNIQPAEQEQHNWLITQGRNKKWFSFGRFKTSNTYGRVEVPVSKPVNNSVNVWLRFHTGPWLLDDHELSAPRMSQLITETFSPTGKQLSCSMLRHVFISEAFPPDLKQRLETARRMQHSLSTQTAYSLDIDAEPI